MKKTNMLILLGFLSLSVIGSAKTQQTFEEKNYSIEITKEKSELISESNSGNAEENGRQEQNLFGKERKKVDENTQTNGKSEKKSLWNKIVNRKKSDKNEEWKLIWEDEFDSNSLDTSKWSYWGDNNIPWNAGNYLDEKGNLVDQSGFKVKHYYLKDNVKVQDGNLVIEVKKENNKTVNIDGKQRKILYSSGAVHTKGKFSVQEGKIEMRAAMPKGVGTWPAFWMWPEWYSQGTKLADGEIDIFEIYGSDLSRVTGTTHVLKTTENKYQMFDGDDEKIKKNEDLTQFNTYAVEWDSKEVKWLFNGRVYKKRTMKEMEKKAGRNPFNQPYFLMINVALENQTGSDGDVDFPTEMKVDYVRVYKKDK